MDTGVIYYEPDAGRWVKINTYDAPLISWVTDQQGPLVGHNKQNRLTEPINSVAFNLHNNVSVK